MKRFCLLKLFLISTLLVACSRNPMAAIYDNDSKIASQGNSYNYYQTVDQNINDSDFTASVHGMDGMDTVWTYNADTDSDAQITYDISLKSGNVKLVLISPDDTLETIFEITNKENINGAKTLSLPKGKNSIKLVSKDKAEFDISFCIDKGDYEKLSF
ncbi:hypothetical protein SAMN02910298_00665 [Pseudobutyrivibrio sp. YE44]|uniref:hypothetical protein n=1 Tax=Pseudobutyrivibrio sp. YE44 TaxID=1520802 RepID=UPI00088271A5|nr:hypothetical protein [Pseudobutyrivibrio sp. YE44]SDB12843.1 hypothetical protein SAMN02910298_00665 [Pseudobutyrivibrio sp. YE44]